MSPAVLARLKAEWGAEHARWQGRDCKAGQEGKQKRRPRPFDAERHGVAYG